MIYRLARAVPAPGRGHAAVVGAEADAERRAQAELLADELPDVVLAEVGALRRASVA